MKTDERYRFVIDYFKDHHPNAETELEYSTAFELLVAVILSAQCTDKRVNMITPALFSRFPDAESLSAASVDEVFSSIRSISYPNNKAKHLVGMAKMLLSDFNGVVPEKVEDLIKLPGVGRKTANVIASVVFNQPAMAVDTHVFRVSARLGLTRNARNPKQAEEQLVKFFPKELIAVAHHWLILHGRYVCKARKPECTDCGLKQICNFYLRAQKKSSKIAPFKQNKM
jgi:endonuclease-3